MPEVSQLSAAVLAGGFGTRLKTVVSDRPKPLAQVNGRPFLAYLLERIAQAGIKRTLLMTGFLADQVEQAIGPEFAGMEIVYSREEEPLGTGGALRMALPLINSRAVMVMNGDSFCRADYRAMRQWHQNRGAHASMLLTRVADASRYGQVTLGPDQMITGFQEKGAGQGSGWINAGVYLLNRELLKEIPEGRKVSLETEIFPRWVGGVLHGYQCLGGFLDIGTPESFARAQRFFI